MKQDKNKTNKTNKVKNINIIQQLRTSDAAEGGTEVDPFSQAAGGLEEPKFPVLAADRICEFKIHSAKVAATKETADQPEVDQRKLLTVTVKTTKDYVDADGKPLRAGFPVYLRYGLTPTEPTEDKRGRTKQQIAEEIGMLLKGIGQPGKSVLSVINDPSSIEGGIFNARTSIQPPKDGYGASNRLTIKLPA